MHLSKCENGSAELRVSNDFFGRRGGIAKAFGLEERFQQPV